MLVGDRIHVLDGEVSGGFVEDEAGQLFDDALGFVVGDFFVFGEFPFAELVFEQIQQSGLFVWSEFMVGGEGLDEVGDFFVFDGAVELAPIFFVVVVFFFF